MKAAVLVKHGKAEEAFEIKEVAKPEPGPQQVLIEVETSGINFADVLARMGKYKDAPEPPSVLGYDVCGRVVAMGKDVEGVEKGQRVVALTRFGGYAEYALADARGLIHVSDDMDATKATALATQYCTAYYAGADLMNMYPGDHVLVHAAAGGVGTALVQLAKHKGCTVYGTAGSPKKLEYLREQGVDHPINYRATDWAEEVKKIRGDGRLDVIFDPIGAKYVKIGFALLGSGGRFVTFGASSFTNANNFFKKFQLGMQFGFYHPAKFLMTNKSMLGVNMLRLADHKPESFARVSQQVSRYAQEGVFNPTAGGTFPADQIGEAHAFLESRKSIGKVAVSWK
ncbi:MAG: zinc-binding alcohol dehydrogenase family protein [Bacteroidia bacterium]